MYIWEDEEIEGNSSDINVTFMERPPEGCEYLQQNECNCSVVRLALLNSQPMECPDVIDVPCLISLRRIPPAAQISNSI
ncbi:hypothetical protein DPMN_016067 [Dreissena polymorpha]|uniref:Uncharacterized protein n=1 Tax=Dreissena polymorpha TaxID=45954 RepID=A0A9D4NEV9_DREPO|nr:hypothetical protein DPMN_016067 [Dreissena polymorpha]